MTSLLDAQPDVLGAQEPRVGVWPAYSTTTGEEVVELCEMAGLSLDPWQQLVIRHGLGERDDGKWAAPDVGVVVARQNGKGGIIEARELAGLFLLDEPIAHLDLKHQIAMLELFAGAARECDAAVAMVLHEPGLAWRFCDRALLVHGDGVAESGSTHDMLTAGRLSALYQYPLQALESDGYISFVPR